MQRFIGLSHLLLILLLQLAPAQISPIPEESSPTGESCTNNSTCRTVITFQEVWTKSMCQPMEMLVDVEQEFPGEVEYMYMPPCVALRRCSGCCGDENMECHPTLKRNITAEVMRIVPLRSITNVELVFEEHLKCECRRGESIKNKPRRMKRKKTANSCDKCQLSQNKITLH
ncbi:snake venom vascular endothelial growth factor toxin apiscin-like isoform X3 [Mastacembelus armatus]|uniref:snake venom vascular endothelial growth factor toxin apiscin-like isoform X3 n=1 Tax=Mastacembelus armatus TaxID=205130 RepID=UPI000E458138|nr:snake venom vascular endothelial growth factor toxin apiscin-like isoform X3 [Mastacembelus armatus]